MTVGADADRAVQPDPGARLDARDLRAAIEDGSELAGGVADLAGQHGVPGRLAGPDLRGVQAALDGRMAGLAQRPDGVGARRRCGPLVVVEAAGPACRDRPAASARAVLTR